MAKEDRAAKKERKRREKLADKAIAKKQKEQADAQREKDRRSGSGYGGLSV